MYIEIKCFCGVESSVSEHKKGICSTRTVFASLQGYCDVVYYNVYCSCAGSTSRKYSYFFWLVCLYLLMFACVCACTLTPTLTHTPSCVGTRMRLTQGLRSCAPSVALRGLKPICLSAAQNADRQTSTRLTQCWDWNGLGGLGGLQVEQRRGQMGCWDRGGRKGGGGGRGRQTCMCTCLNMDVLVRPASYGLTSTWHRLIAGSGVKWDSGKRSHVLLCPRFSPPITEMFIYQMQYTDSGAQFFGCFWDT